MRKALLVTSLFILSSCGESPESKVERDVLITLAKRLERVERKLKVRIPPEEKFWIFNSEAAMKEAIKQGRVGKR